MLPWTPNFLIRHSRLFTVFVAQLCLTLCDPIDHSLPGSSAHVILQVRILEWIAIPFSRGSSWLRDWTGVSWIAGRFFTVWATRGAQALYKLAPISRSIFFPHTFPLFEKSTQPQPWLFCVFCVIPDSLTTADGTTQWFPFSEGKWEPRQSWSARNETGLRREDHMVQKLRLEMGCHDKQGLVVPFSTQTWVEAEKDDLQKKAKEW